jgi:hypothetical protein
MELSENLELENALKELPPLSNEYNEDKLIAKVMLRDDISTWEWYLCEYDPLDRIANGLVKGYDLEYGFIDYRWASPVKAHSDF